MIVQDNLGDWVKCSNPNCAIDGPCGKSDGAAITAWNTRAALNTTAGEGGVR